MAIDERRFDALWRLTDGRRVSKTRHVIPLAGGPVAELDVYDGDLDGLLIVEIEFRLAGGERALSPRRRGWGAEVTGDKTLRQPVARAGGPPAAPVRTFVQIG